MTEELTIIENDNQGPRSWQNWRSFNAGHPARSAYEVPLFSDARVTGKIQTGLGPFQILNPVPSEMRTGILRPAIYLRIEDHCQSADNPLELLKTNKTDERHYVGGGINDEFAALASLSLGLRCKAGGITRYFDEFGDPRGRPTHWLMHDDPVLPYSHGPARIPQAVTAKSLDDLRVLEVLPQLDCNTSVEVLRAARLYQDAIWLAEVEPNLCWILLVSAVEAAAAVWRGHSLSARERFLAWGPATDMVPHLVSAGGEKLVQKIADIVSSYVGSNRTFVDFIVAHCPDPPSRRPPEWAQLSWDESSLRKVFRLVYNYRSRALHAGRRFPAPMLEPPFKLDGSLAPAEVPIGLASAQEGGMWQRKDTPLLLHSFENIVRGALVAWLSQLGKES